MLFRIRRRTPPAEAPVLVGDDHVQSLAHVLHEAVAVPGAHARQSLLEVVRAGDVQTVREPLQPRRDQPLHLGQAQLLLRTLDQHAHSRKPAPYFTAGVLPFLHELRLPGDQEVALAHLRILNGGQQPLARDDDPVRVLHPANRFTHPIGLIAAGREVEKARRGHEAERR